MIFLINTPAYLNGEDILLTGLFWLVEYNGYEPSAYVFSPCWTIAPVSHELEGWEYNPNLDSVFYDVDADVVEQIIDPEGYARRAAMEDEIEPVYSEDEEMGADV